MLQRLDFTARQGAETGYGTMKLPSWFDLENVWCGHFGVTPSNVNDTTRSIDKIASELWYCWYAH